MSVAKAPVEMGKAGQPNVTAYMDERRYARQEKEVLIVVRIRGIYEYDDEDLTPGKKKEGGLHQNLFDEDGNLKGSARFIPDEDQSEDDQATPEDSYGPTYDDPYLAAQQAIEDAEGQREWERERQESAEAIADLVVLAATIAYVEARPYIQRFWREKISPALQARRETRARRRAERHARREQKAANKQTELAEVVPHIAEEAPYASVETPSTDLSVASQAYRHNMSSAEAQARYLMALAARAFSEEQLRMVANANIVEDEPFVQLQTTLAQLPPAQVAQLVSHLEKNSAIHAEGAFDLDDFLQQVAERQHAKDLRRRPFSQ